MPVATNVARGTRVNSARRPRPASTAAANITRTPKRAGARSRLNPGTAAYMTRYRPARGLNDAQNANAAIVPYKRDSSAARLRPDQPATTPTAPKAVAVNPVNSASPERPASRNTHEWAAAPD